MRLSVLQVCKVGLQSRMTIPVFTGNECCSLNMVLNVFIAEHAPCEHTGWWRHHGVSLGFVKDWFKVFLGLAVGFFRLGLGFL